MKKQLVIGLMAAFCASPAFAALKVGDAAPDFTAAGSLGGKDFSFNLKTALKKGPVVVYFYPSAYTGGCDLEAHTFAEQSSTRYHTWPRGSPTMCAGPNTGVSCSKVGRLRASRRATERISAGEAFCCPRVHL